MWVECGIEIADKGETNIKIHSKHWPSEWTWPRAQIKFLCSTNYKRLPFLNRHIQDQKHSLVSDKCIYVSVHSCTHTYSHTHMRALTQFYTHTHTGSVENIADGIKRHPIKSPPYRNNIYEIIITDMYMCGCVRPYARTNIHLYYYGYLLIKHLSKVITWNVLMDGKWEKKKIAESVRDSWERRQGGTERKKHEINNSSKSAPPNVFRYIYIEWKRESVSVCCSLLLLLLWLYRLHPPICVSLSPFIVCPFMQARSLYRIRFRGIMSNCQIKFRLIC